MTIMDFTQRLLAHLGLEKYEVLVEEEGERIQVQINVPEEDSGLLIGYHGEGLQAIQSILSSLHTEVGEKKVIVNINDYVQRREEQLKDMTEEIIENVLASGQPHLFFYLPGRERLVVHQTVSQHPRAAELESVSSGEGKNRRLQIRIRVEETTEDAA